MKKILMTSLAGVVLGCGAVRTELAPAVNFEIEKKSYETKFFVGKDWYDRNNDGFMDKGDGYYNPEVFRGSDKILIIGEIEGYDGWLTTRIWNNKNEQIVRTAMKEVSRRALVRYDLTAQDIMNNLHGGEGEYRVNWYIGENFDIEKIGEKTFRVEK